MLGISLRIPTAVMSPNSSDTTLKRNGPARGPSRRSTYRAAVLLLLRLLVVEGLVPLVLRLPRILQDGTEHRLEQQDAQVDDQEGVHGPATEQTPEHPSAL